MMMKFPTAATVISTIGLLLSTSQAQLLLPFFTNPSRPATHHQHQQQQPMSPPPQPQDNILISDIIGTQRNINIFAAFTRDILSVSQRLDNTALNTTVLAPINSAISSLPRKPWEDAKDYDRLGAAAYVGSEGSERASKNLRRFTEAHVVPRSPWKEGEKVVSMGGGGGGGEVWWEKRDGVVRVLPGDVEVERVLSRVANGEVWVLKGVLDYAT